MYKALFVPLFCILLPVLLLVGCHQHRDSRSVPHSDSVKAEVGAKEPVIDLDTGMVSLKVTRSVALIDVLSQGWKVKYVDHPHWNEHFRDSSENEQQCHELALFKDYSATENARYAIKMGIWQLNKEKRELQIQYNDGSHKTYSILQIGVKQMMLEHEKDNKAGDWVRLGLSADALVHSRPLEDPFYPANNQWRIKPRASETEKQIRSRLKGYVHFYSLFFRDNRQRQSKDISFSGLPACLVWYNGGIGLPEKNDMDHRWKDCFYSEEEAMKGYGILGAILQSHTLKWPEHPTSWIKQTYEVLDQIYDKL